MEKSLRGSSGEQETKQARGVLHEAFLMPKPVFLKLSRASKSPGRPVKTVFCVSSAEILIQ